MSTIAETPALVGIPDEHTQNIANRIAYLNLVLYNQSINLEQSRKSLIEETQSKDSSLLVEEDPIYEDISFDEELNFGPAKKPGSGQNIENA